MKQNLLIISYDYDLSKRLANRLAESFSMRVFDQIELFEFDHLPRKLSDIISSQGMEYVLKKMRSLLKMELDFDDAVFVCNLATADSSEDLFFKVNLSNFVVFLHKEPNIELRELLKKHYSSRNEREFFVPNRAKLIEREKKVAEFCADVNLNITNLSDDEIEEKIVEKIKEYYSVDWFSQNFIFLRGLIEKII